MSGETDCRSDVGVTVGLIDGLIAIARVLAHRDFGHAAVQEALADLAADEDLRTVSTSVGGTLRQVTDRRVLHDTHGAYDAARHGDLNSYLAGAAVAVATFRALLAAAPAPTEGGS